MKAIIIKEMKGIKMKETIIKKIKKLITIASIIVLVVITNITAFATTKDNKIETLTVEKTKVENNIYHVHTGNSSHYGNCYTLGVACGGYYQRHSYENKCHGSFTIHTSYWAQCNKCGESKYNSVGGGWHQYPPGQCGQVISSGSYTQCTRCGVRNGNGSCNIIKSYDLNCKKDANTPVARLNLEKETEDWKKELDIKATYQVLDDSFQVSKTPYTWNGTGETNNPILTIAENGDYDCKLNASKSTSDNASTEESKVKIKITNLDNTPPTIQSAPYQESQFVYSSQIEIIAKDIQQDGFAIGGMGSGLAEKPYSYDNGKTWTSSTKLDLNKNGTYKIKVKDILGNTQPRTEVVTNIDNIAPTIASIQWNKSKFVDTTTLEITASDKQEDGYALHGMGIGLAEKAYSYDNGNHWIESNSQTIDKNGVYHIKVKDIIGNTTTQRIFVDNIDDQPPTIHKLSSNQTQWTKETIMLTVEAEDYHTLPIDPNTTNPKESAKEVTNPIGSGLADKAYSWDDGNTWTDSKHLEVDKNGIYKVIVRDNIGNQTEATITIRNIDKTKPLIESVSYNSIKFVDKTTLEITSTDPQIDGYAIENLGSGLAKNPFSFDNGLTWGTSNLLPINQNDTYYIKVRDVVGNISEKRIFVNNIDKQPPTINDFYNHTKGWTGSDIELIVKAKDYHITPIDKEEKEIQHREINPNDLLQEYEIGCGLAEKPYSWDDGITWTHENKYKVRENGTYKVIVKDKFDNRTEKSIVVDNIDKKNPLLNITTNAIDNKWINGNCEITANASDLESGLSTLAYSWDEGKTWTKNNHIKITTESKVSVWVRDAVGNKANYTGIFSENEIPIIEEEKKLDLDSNENTQGTIEEDNKKQENNTDESKTDKNNTDKSKITETEEEILKTLEVDEQKINMEENHEKGLSIKLIMILTGAIITFILFIFILIFYMSVSIYEIDKNNCYKFKKRIRMTKKKGCYHINLKRIRRTENTMIKFGAIFIKWNKDKKVIIHFGDCQIEREIERSIVVKE